MIAPSQPLGFAHTLIAPRSFSAFSQQIASECINGSAIAPVLFETAIALVRDTETFAGGDVAYPIHEALNWHLTRFGYQARATLYAALLLNADGSTWQAKLSLPRTAANGKTPKYETPSGNGARAYLPPVPPAIRQQISERYGVNFPSDGAFWDFLEQHPEIPLVISEGGKKSLAGLSQGYVTIALYGCNGGYRVKDALGNPIAPTLIPDLARFAVAGRPITLAFDADDTAKTRRRVNIAQSRLGTLLAVKGCAVAIAQWDSQQGKGLDDLIVNAGAAAWEAAYANALPLSQWQILQRLERQLTYPINLRVNLGDLAQLDPAPLPSEGMMTLCSPKGTGKTKLIATLLTDQERVLSLTHRIALCRVTRDERETLTGLLLDQLITLNQRGEDTSGQSIKG